VVASENRRQMAVRLTTQGQRLLKKTEQPVRLAYQQLMTPLTQKESQQLIYLLQRLTNELQNEARAPFVPL
jgi:DNA-binding MarR family transcriptional regulator